MNHGKTVSAQLMSMMPEYEFDKCVTRYNGNFQVRNFSCRDHFYVMGFAQLPQRDSLRDIENCLKLFPWATIRESKGGIKMHALLDLKCHLPVFVNMTEAFVHGVKILDELYIEPAAIYVIDQSL